jgi:hypothetical protein
MTPAVSVGVNGMHVVDGDFFCCTLVGRFYKNVTGVISSLTRA